MLVSCRGRVGPLEEVEPERALRGDHIGAAGRPESCIPVERTLSLGARRQRGRGSIDEEGGMIPDRLGSQARRSVLPNGTVFPKMD